MPEAKSLEVKNLKLDLANFRTVHQESEREAIKAMIATSPDRFWALMDSLIIDGYLPTESILVLKESEGKTILTVKEGNRRVAVLKLIHGFLSCHEIDIPSNLDSAIKKLPTNWIRDNTSVPCVVYNPTERDKVDKIVTLAHGKGEKAGRDQWNAVARARHNRDEKGANEPALDLLEKYLLSGQNLTKEQSARWAGNYPLTVLEEAIKKIAPRIGLKSAKDLSHVFPNLPHRDSIEDVLRDIGLALIGFDTIRKKDFDFAANYGIPPLNKNKSKEDTNKNEVADKNKGRKEDPRSRKPSSASIGNPTTVKALLRKFSPLGSDKAKIVTLRDEARSLSIDKNPLAFCFVIRSMFEISAKAYCNDQKASGGPSYIKSNGKEKTLEEVLRDITSHLTKSKSDKIMVRKLHGAMTELGRKEGLLSVTSLNQLIHNPTFSITAHDICVLFGNIYPLLEVMNG